MSNAKKNKPPETAMDPKPHPVVLENVYFTRSIVVAIPEYKPDESVLADSPANSIDIAAIDADAGRYVATMRMVMNQEGGPSAPYLIDMESIGTFVVDKALPPEEAQRAVMITAHSVLYGAIREAVAWITGRQPHGQVMLGLSILKPLNKPNID